MRLKTSLLVLFVLAVPAAADTLAPQSIDSLFAVADFVGIVRIDAGIFEMGKGAVYKASILQVLKGDSVDCLFIGPWRGEAIGSDYLVFLAESKESVAEHWSKDIHHDGPRPTYLSRLINQFSGRGDSASAKPPPTQELPSTFTHNAKFYAVIFEGFGSIPIEYTVQLHAEAAKIACSHVILPDFINRKPISDVDSRLWELNWVDLDQLINYLGHNKATTK